MRQTYRVMAGLIALGVVVQAAAIAFGWFTAISDVDGGLVIDQNYEGNGGHALHGIMGFFVMPALGLIFLIVGLVAGRTVPHGRTWAAIVFAAIVVQVVLAMIAFGVPAIGALHGINALVILGTAGRAAMLARTPAPAVGQAPAGTSLPV